MLGSTDLLRRSPETSYRQLDYWTRIGVIKPLVDAHGSGSRRRFDERHVYVLRMVTALAALGMECPAMERAASEALEMDLEWWHRGSVIVAPSGDLAGEDKLGIAGYVVDLRACTQEPERLSA